MRDRRQQSTCPTPGNRPERRRLPPNRAARAVTLTLLAVLLAARTAHAAPPAGPAPDGAKAGSRGIVWLDLGVDEAIARGRAADRLVLLDIWASWCEPCRRQEAEIWTQDAGAEIGRRTIPIHVDFETPEGQKLKRRFSVLGLPSLIVLDGHGEEVDRLVGYEDREAWLGELGPILEGTDPIPALEKRVRSAPQSPAPRLELARRRLYRGDEAAAYREFLDILTLGPPPETGAEVYFLMGRYLQRVRERPAEALPYWKLLARDYAETSYLMGAVAWGLDAHKETGAPDEGLAWADAISRDRADDAELHYLIAAWAHEKKLRHPTALAHARRAKELGAEATDLDEVLGWLSGAETR